MRYVSLALIAVFAWPLAVLSAEKKAELMSSGTSRDLDAFEGLRSYAIPESKLFKDIVAMGIAGSNDHVYTWYSDGTVSVGSSIDLDRHKAPREFSLPPGKNASDIVGMGIAGSNDHVYTWYRDGTVSVGSSLDLDRHEAPREFSLPPGKNISDIVGLGIAGSNDHVYTWYKDGTRSVGSSLDLDRHEAPGGVAPTPGKQFSEIVGIGIAGSDDHVYVWFRELESSCCKLSAELDPIITSFRNSNQIPGLTVAISKGGQLVLAGGYGYADFAKRTKMERGHGVRSGSTTKVFTAVAAMHLIEKSMPKKVADIVEIGIAGSNDHVYSWYRDGTVVVGSSLDLDRHEWPRKFSLPPGKQVADIVGIGIAGSNDHVYAWYRDGTRSVGSSLDLDRHEAPRGFSLPSGKSVLDIVAMGIAGSNDHVYTWYRDGTRSVGSSLDLDRHEVSRGFSLPQGTKLSDIVGIGIAGSNDHVYALFSNKERSVGSSLDLDRHQAPRGFSLPSAITLNTPVYGPNGILKDPAYLDAVPASNKSEQIDWYKAMQVRHLLSHTAGFQGGGDPNGAAAMFGVDRDDVTYKQIHLHKLSISELQFAPGTDWDYSNHGMGLVGHLVSVVSGVPFYSYLRSKILDDPDLDLKNIVAWGTEVGPIYSTPHTYDGNAIKTQPIGKDVGVKLAAGGLLFSCRDAVKFLLATDRLPSPPDVLKPETLATMESPAFPAIKSDQAFGWKILVKGDGKSTKLGHGGVTSIGTSYLAKFQPGYKTNAGVDLGEINVCVGANIDVKGGSGVLRGLADQIAIAVATIPIPPGSAIP